MFKIGAFGASYFALALVVSLARPLTAQEGNASHGEQLEFCLSGISASRQLLSDAVFSAKGYQEAKLQHYPEANGVYDLVISGAFDRQGRIRFDRAIPDLVMGKGETQEADEPNSGRLATRILEKKYFNDGKKAGIWTVGSHTISLDKPTNRWNSSDLVPILDPRGLGLLGWVELKAGKEIDIITEQMLQAWTSNSFLLEVDSTNDIWVVSATTNRPGTPTSQVRMWVDVYNGFTVTRKDVRRRKSEAWFTTQSYEVEWQEMQPDVFVPIHFEMNLTPTPNDAQKVVFDFNWEEVNSTLPDRLFSYDGFGADESVRVDDISTGQVITIREPVRRPTGGAIEVPNHGNPTARIAIVLVSVVFFFFAVGIGMRLLRKK